MPKVSANLLRAKINGQFIACETQCEFNYEVEMRGASAVTSGRWKEVIPGVRSWNMTINAALLLTAAGANIHVILNAILTGEILELEFKTDVSLIPELVIVGKAFVSGGAISSVINTNVNWNTTLTGSGPFTFQAGAFRVGFGYTNVNPSGNEAGLTPQFFQDVGIASMDLDFTTASSGNYLYAIVPIALTTVFDEWYNSMINFGPIPDFVWREPVVVGGNRYYITRDPLYITAEVPNIIFSKA